MATKATGKTRSAVSTHDRKVRQIVRELEKQGCTVRADVRGRERPRPVGSERLVPDIEATKDGRRRIIEVETPESLKLDKDHLEKLKGFARHASKDKNISFDIVVTRPRKK